jgi:RNA polymerase sigma-70 factor (ECF subfamily)
MNPKTQGAFLPWVEALAREHARALAAVAAREGLTADDALDAVQEAFTTLLGLPQARSLAGSHEDSFALLAVIVRNAARNARRLHRHAQPHLPVASLLADDGPSVDALVAAAEEHVAVLGCVQKLAEVQRHVVTLRLIEQMSGAEVALALGLAPGHIAVLLHRAKKALQRCLTM